MWVKPDLVSGKEHAVWLGFPRAEGAFRIQRYGDRKVGAVTTCNLDILGYNQIGPFEFNEIGHYVGKDGEVGQTADFTNQSAP